MNLLIVPLRCIVIALAEPGRKGRGLLMGIQVGDVSKRGHAENGGSFPAFFCHDSGHGGGSGTGSVPQHHGGDVQQMADKHTAGSEVAEEKAAV